MQERRVNTRGIIFKNGLLFAQQLKANSGPNQFWSTPGGGLDPNESLTDGLRREMIEETGIAPVIGKLLFIQQFNDGKREQLEFFFHIENANDYDVIDLSKTSHGDIEIEANAFIDPKTEHVLPAFLKNIDIGAYIEISLPILVVSEL
jgi:ADP-ribose pyrophosphatase YjhB (NUDIX family)